MANPLMPKATAVWLVENSSLTFEQIADFCDLHALEVQGIADDEVAIGIQGLDPIVRKQLTRAEIDRCEKDPSARLGHGAARGRYGISEFPLHTSNMGASQGRTRTACPRARSARPARALTWSARSCRCARSIPSAGAPPPPRPARSSRARPA